MQHVTARTLYGNRGGQRCYTWLQRTKDDLATILCVTMGNDLTSWRILSRRRENLQSLRLGGCFLVSKIRVRVCHKDDKGRGEGGREYCCTQRMDFSRLLQDSTRAWNPTEEESLKGKGKRAEKKKKRLKCFGVSRWFVTIDRGWENRDKEEKTTPDRSKRCSRCLVAQPEKCSSIWFGKRSKMKIADTTLFLPRRDKFGSLNLDETCLRDNLGSSSNLWNVRVRKYSCDTTWSWILCSMNGTDRQTCLKFVGNLTLYYNSFYC